MKNFNLTKNFTFYEMTDSKESEKITEFYKKYKPENNQ